MLDLLRRRDHHRVARAVLRRLADHVVAFGEQVLDALAFLAAGRHPQPLENLFKTVDVLLRLLQMLFECRLQLPVGRSFRELRQRLRQLLLGVVNVLQFFLQQIFERIQCGHGASVKVSWLRIA